MINFLYKYFKFISSSYDNFDRREAQRETWLASSKIEHKYIIDKWTPEWKAENDIFGDIVSINASFSGYAKGFGEKLYHWFQYAADNYPEGTIVGKTDDDFYGCANLFDTGKGTLTYSLYTIQYTPLTLSAPVGTSHQG